MGTKIGVYICGGCEIGKAVDVAALAKMVQRELKPELCRTDDLLCSPEGSALIRRDAEEQGLGAVCIAACSPRLKTEELDLDPSRIACDRVGLRELVARVSKPRHEDTQALAEDYLRMGVTRARKMSLVKASPLETSRCILVVGGGVTGLSAALEAARAGRDVLLVERDDRLGGFLGRVSRIFPRSAPYTEPEESPAAALAEEVAAHPRISVRLGARVERTSGQPGQLDVTIRQGDATSTLRVGAVVVATGFEPYDPGKLGHLGYGRSPNVLTCEELEARLAEGKEILRPSDGEPLRSVAFLLCAGSRDPAHLPYCSTVCCRTALKQALLVRRLCPGAMVYLFYRDLRAPGHHEDFYRHVQRDPGIFMTRAEVEEVRPSGQAVQVELRDTLLGPRLEVEADLLVLATGMRPVTVHEDDSALGLQYRQGPNLPMARHSFPDSRFVCFPYETRRTAIFSAGCVREPMDSARAADDAAGAAMKAIQAVELLGQGRALHPRAGDPGIPEFFMQRCTQCKRCTEECPFGALDEDAKGTPLPNPNRCRRCGICMGACPERIVSFPTYSVGMIGDALKSIEVPEAEEEKPRVVVLACENDAYPAIDVAAQLRLGIDPRVRIQPVRCLGSMNIIWIADCLSKGIDGVLLLGCKHGDDYQCHFIHGSELASRRLENLQETLNRLMLERDRVRLEQVSITDHRRIPVLIEEFMAKIEELGPNPYKGM